MTSHRVVIVGASIAGITCAESLRAEGFDGRVTVVGAETGAPYSRPPLSKQVLTGEWEGGETGILPAGDLHAIDVDLRLGVTATAVDLHARRVTAEEDGQAAPLDYDTLIVATGVRARRLARVRRGPGVHELRTLADAVALRSEIVTGARVVVVGSGILGSEVAAAARKLGASVALVGHADRLRFGQVGDRLSDRIATLHRQNGVRLIAGVDVVGIASDPADGRASAVELSDGTRLSADVVVTAVGCRPAVEWLTDSTLDLADGVVCDERGLAAPGVFAIGDVAAWRDPATGIARRAEHQLGAVEQAHAVARLIATGEPSPRPLPFFWSELYGQRIQAYGDFSGGGELTVVAGINHEGGTADRFVAESRSDDGLVTGIVGWNMPRDFRLARSRVGIRPLIDPPAQLVGTAKGLPA